jgi:hypothetical protein
MEREYECNDPEIIQMILDTLSCINYEKLII